MNAPYKLREWDYLTVGDDRASIGRQAADELSLIAEQAERDLGLGGGSGERVLENHVSRLRAQQTVGVIVAPGASLEILPKIDGLETDDGATRVNLVRMLARTFDLPIAEGSLTELGTQTHDLLEILIRLFVDKLFTAVHRGLPRRYVGCQDDLPLLRGSLDLKRQFTTLAATPHKLASRFDELSPDIPLNRLMRTAVLRLRAIARTLGNQRRLTELALAFAEVGDMSATDLQQVILDRTNTEWHELVRLARLLLRNDFQTTSRGATRGYSLLFEMNALFEEFIGRTLQMQLQKTDQSVKLQGPQGHVLIDKAGGAKRFRTRPDVTVHQFGRPTVVIDTKWKRLKGDIEDPKRGVGSGDVYQMLAYGEVYGVNQLMLLYPHHSGLGHPPGLLAEYRFIGATDRTLKIASVSLERVESVPAQLNSLLDACSEPVPIAA